jgi:hypothetical protein
MGLNAARAAFVAFAALAALGPGIQRAAGTTDGRFVPRAV